MISENEILETIAKRGTVIEHRFTHSAIMPLIVLKERGHVESFWQKDRHGRERLAVRLTDAGKERLALIRKDRP